MLSETIFSILKSLPNLKIAVWDARARQKRPNVGQKERQIERLDIFVDEVLPQVEGANSAKDLVIVDES